MLLSIMGVDMSQLYHAISRGFWNRKPPDRAFCRLTQAGITCAVRHASSTPIFSSHRRMGKVATKQVPLTRATTSDPLNRTVL